MRIALSRKQVGFGIAAVWLLGTVVLFLAFATPRQEVVSVVHWSNGHMMRAGLLPDMAQRFNRLALTTGSGKPINVQVSYYGSAEQVADLASRVTRGTPLDPKLPDPTLITPSADHWIISGNAAAGRALVDMDQTQSIARTWVGIVTFRDMAECLGWPQKEIGYADIIALRDDPRGWAAYPCAKAEWGRRPLVAFTDPTTSSTGRSVLYSLYAIAAGKTPDQLRFNDVTDPKVAGYVKQFQQLVDHYMIGTMPLNSKVYQGPRYGHFFLMPEDNLIHLYEGTERVLIDGREVQAPPLARSMVMIYPKEGATAHNHSAAPVNGPWVTDEMREAASRWVAFLHEDEQQRAFMKSGFRPVTGLAPADPISGRYGLDPSKPATVVNPDRIDQGAAKAIEQSWEEIKKPGIVTFVVDTSGSMNGLKLEQAKSGLVRALDAMAKNTRVGLLTFSDKVTVRIPIGPLAENRFELTEAVEKMRADGGTALYDAVKMGIQMTERAPGATDAIRGVVVLSDGQANQGSTLLHDLIEMMSTDEVKIRALSGWGEEKALDVNGRAVAKSNVIGAALLLKTEHPVQVFFIGIGQDADLAVGRMLAQATGAEFQASAEKDLAKVLQEYSKYF